ncbi:disulfide bond formation protein B [Pontivivens insulae]|uniref:Disulfide bond formation protein B n=1 Tax=Pontivivens insulae TaxID=1639689 RepID=A0A2R8ABV8_9RHOB|nr:disulfide bond formation protein B [Pontivivens insulae]RED11086.1 disulfide bond formation protein DsbB [Pontivivens insulae]SPF29739.1 Disulfide bond formation protein B [Pontivivens insulae]
MTRHLYILLTTSGSIALLGGALLFQYVGGLAPCQMCIWQRWPHAAAIVLGVLALAQIRRARGFAAIAALAMLIGAGIGVFHAGVEWDWWEGITACAGSGNALDGLTGDSLLPSSGGALGVVRCDEAAWVFLGLSMAGWNAVFSLILAGLWIKVASTPRAAG